MVGMPPILAHNIPQNPWVFLEKPTLLEKSPRQFMTARPLKQVEKLRPVAILFKPALSIDVRPEKPSPKRILQAPLKANLKATDKKKGTLLRVKLLGLEKPEQEGAVFRALFEKQALWKQFDLYALSKDYVMYQGRYAGSVKQLANRAKTLQNPAFRVRNVRLEKNLLELTLQWQEEVTPLLKYQPIPVVQRWVRTKKLFVPRRSVPSNHVNKIFELPRSIGVYDYLRSRGDSTFYQVDWAKSGQTVRGIWSEIARTNLSPMLSVYDAQRNLVERHRPKKGIIRFNYRLPKGQSRFYIRISDGIGHIQGEAGSYLSLHYALQVSPKK